LNKSISTEDNDIIMRAIAKAPSDRYANGLEFSKALKKIQDEPKTNNKNLSLLDREKIDISENPEFLEISEDYSFGREKPSLMHYDWFSILLSILALIMAGGLIPFWIYIYLTISSINR
jgi:serine/threonine protein kinase